MRNTHPHYEIEAGPQSLSLSPSPKSFKVSLLLHRPDPTNFFLGRLAHSFLLSSSSLLVWRRAHRIMTRRDGAEVSREGEGESSRERYNIDFESGSGNNCDCKSGLPGPRQQQAGLPSQTLLSAPSIRRYNAMLWRPQCPCRCAAHCATKRPEQRRNSPPSSLLRSRNSRQGGERPQKHVAESRNAVNGEDRGGVEKVGWASPNAEVLELKGNLNVDRRSVSNQPL